MLNNIERNVSGAAEYVQASKAETHKAVTYKKNPYKVASLPGFLKSFKKKTRAQTGPDPSDQDQD